MRVRPGLFLIVLTLASPAIAQDEKPGSRTFELQFVAAEWESVISTLAETSGLQLDKHDPLPKGTFTFRGKSKYSLDQAVSIINRQLLRQGCIRGNV